MRNPNKRVRRLPRHTPTLGGAGPGPERKHTPFPGVIDGNAWIIKEGRWPSYIDRTDIDGEGAVMRVPVEDEPTARKLRLHEQAHVAWTPNISDVEILDMAIDPETVGACEDGRIIQLMNRRKDRDWMKVNLSANIIPDVGWAQHKQAFQRLAGRLAGTIPMEVPPTEQGAITLLDAARTLAATRGYVEGDHFDQIAAEANLDWIVDAIERMHKQFLGTSPRYFGRGKKDPTFEDTIEYARELERFFNDMEIQLIHQAQELDDADMPNMQTPELIDGDNEWGEMNIEHAPLSQKLQGNPARKMRPNDMGAVPRYMHRLVSDQRVFGRKRKHKRFQGTVLIDHSGSMSLSPEEVDEILFRWPAVTIATYSGHDHAYGILRIVAKDGKRAGIEWLGPPAGSDNLVDGPALDWLARQKGPRVWISDGGVTGIAGHSADLVLDAAKKVNRGKIKRIENVQELLGRT